MTAISIALCTYQGSRYLPEQLASLAGQTLAPLELVICDDDSRDDSHELATEFSHTAGLNVRQRKNPRRLGLSANFSQAIAWCCGEAIALCDQDDIWQPEKLERFARHFSSGAGWVCCDAVVSDQTLAPVGYTLWERVGFTAKQRRQARQGGWFEVLLKHNVVAGATLAFRADLRDKLLPIPENWLYDAWLAAVLAAIADGVLLEEALQLYRQHGSNAIGGLRKGIVHEARMALALDRQAYLREEIQRWSVLAGHLRNIAAPQAKQRLLAAKLGHLQRRCQFPKNRLMRLPAIMAEIFRGGYARYSRNWGSIAIDLLVC